MKNQKRSKSQGQVAYFSKKNTSLKYKKATLSDAPLQQHCAVHRATATLLPNAIALHPAAHCATGIAHCRSSGAESIILSAGSAESMMLSARAESIILSAPPAESMMLSAQGHACALTLRACSCAGSAESIILSVDGAESMIVQYIALLLQHTS